MEAKLLTRDDFRENVFKRDNYKCVICSNTAKDAHHIIERRLFKDGGYYMDNGASVCEVCHLKAESTEISCDELRAASGITKVIIPEHLYRDQEYDKWGNPILQNGQRLRGDLFDDASVQKVLAPVLHLFTDKVKYPRTYHLPWSPGFSKDDRILEDFNGFIGQEVVVTIKQDGENTSFYRDYIHARSLDYSPHQSRDWVKALHARIAYDIPQGWRVCGENLYAKHSIHYKNLENYFQVFSVWNNKNECLSWDETVDWADLLGLSTVPILWQGVWNEDIIKELYTPQYNDDICEGYVVRVKDLFHYRDFKKVVGKYVRKDHVQTHAHWQTQRVELNGIKDK